jgi:hypothetical protein
MVALLNINSNTNTNMTQEDKNWLEDLMKPITALFKGKIKAILYDIDDSIICEEILESGDCSITFCAGHNYESLEDGSLVYEFKTGPYFGQEKDKVFI